MDDPSDCGPCFFFFMLLCRSQTKTLEMSIHLTEICLSDTSPFDRVSFTRHVSMSPCKMLLLYKGSQHFQPLDTNISVWLRVLLSFLHLWWAALHWKKMSSCISHPPIRICFYMLPGLTIKSDQRKTHTVLIKQIIRFFLFYDVIQLTLNNTI